MMSLRNGIAAAGLITALVSPSTAQQSCESLATLIDQSIGAEAGTAGLVTTMYTGLEAWSTNGISSRFDPLQAGDASGDRFRRDRACPRPKDRAADPQSFQCRYTSRADERVVLDVDMREGDVTYLNPGRRFPGAVENQIDEDTAKQTAIGVAEALGVPPSEIGADFAIVAERIRVTQRRNMPESKQTRRSEVFVKLPRLVNGFPVHGSDARVAIDFAGQPARAYVTWPDFSSAAPVNEMRALSRAEIVARIVEEIGDAAPCGHFGRMVAKVGWIEAPLPGGGGTVTGRYIPGVRLLAIPSDDLPPGRFPGPTFDLTFPIVEALDVDHAG